MEKETFKFISEDRIEEEVLVPQTIVYDRNQLNAELKMINDEIVNFQKMIDSSLVKRNEVLAKLSKFNEPKVVDALRNIN
jgi:myosin heavy subunit